jgi:hypothetical protein
MEEGRDPRGGTEKPFDERPGRRRFRERVEGLFQKSF